MMNKVMFLCSVLNKTYPGPGPGVQSPKGRDAAADKTTKAVTRHLDWGIRLGETLWILNCRHSLSQKTKINQNTLSLKQNIQSAREHGMEI
jgi:hypothetical protein